MAESNNDVKPFLRWAGGKQWLIRDDLERYLPQSIENYHEPFVGGGSIFIYLKSKGLINGRSYLSDLNADLINSYVVVRDDVESLIRALSKFRNTSEFYYKIREKKFVDKVDRAAQFIFLNRTSYNGIYRVNLKGKYNVPFGNKSYKDLFEFENFRKLSALFQDCIFKKQDFYYSLKNIQPDKDFVFLDPPYTVAHEFNGFIKYNQKIFQWKDQERLREFVEMIKGAGVNFLLTNAAHKSIDLLYKDSGKQFKLSRFSVIGGKKAKRDKYNEYVFTN